MDYCENGIKGGCIGKYTGAQGLDLCLKCVSEICKNMYFRGEYYTSDTDSDSSEQNTETTSDSILILIHLSKIQIQIQIQIQTL